MTITDTALLYPGSVIVAKTNPEKIYRVVRRSGTKIVATDAKGDQWNLGPVAAFRDATDAESKAFFESEPVPTFFYPGNVVTFKNPPKGQSLSGSVFVVTKETASGYNLSPLGGDLSGRFYRSVPANAITKVDDGDVDLGPDIEFRNV